MTLDQLLTEMQEHVSSVALNWVEDTNAWECSWITGGERFTGVSTDAVRAVIEVRDKADKRFSGA